VLAVLVLDGAALGACSTLGALVLDGAALGACSTLGAPREALAVLALDGAALGACSTLGALVLDGAALGALVLDAPRSPRGVLDARALVLDGAALATLATNGAAPGAYSTAQPSGRLVPIGCFALTILSAEPHSKRRAG
jgi:hypothetical protein